MDTSVLQCYPTLFALATDILDMLGDMVWERIKLKAEFDEDETKFCFLPGLLLNFFLCVSCFIFLRSSTFEVFLFEAISRICRSATYLYAGLYGINLYAC